MRRARYVIVALLLTASLGCRVGLKAGSHQEDKKAALAALDTFHQRLSDAQFEAIYEDASDSLRAQPKQELLAAMKQTRERWGKFVSSKVVSSSCFPNEVRLVVEAQFEKGLAGEMVIWSVPDKQAHLQHFQMFPGPVQLPSGGANECQPSS
jgi:hypothetical protein